MQLYTLQLTRLLAQQKGARAARKMARTHMFRAVAAAVDVNAQQSLLRGVAAAAEATACKTMGW
jgi:hypothetical protein